MDDCIFCKIVERSVPADIVAEGATWIAFKDVSPQAPTHILVIPKKHHKNIFYNFGDDLSADLINAVREVARMEGLEKEGFRLVLNTGENGGQTVDHLHFHLLGMRKLKWPPG